MKDGPKVYELYGFLTTEPNGVVKPIHGKAMPVILTTNEEVEAWLTAPSEEAVKLQRPLPDNLTTIVPAPIPEEDVTAPAKAPEQPSLF